MLKKNLLGYASNLFTHKAVEIFLESLICIGMPHSADSVLANHKQLSCTQYDIEIEIGLKVVEA